MSLIEEALRRVQETPAPAPVVRMPPPPTTEELESPAAVQTPAAQPVLTRPGRGSIPPAPPSPITISGLAAAGLSVGLLIIVSAVTLRHSSMRALRAPRAAGSDSPATTRSAQAPAPAAPAAAVIETAPQPVAPPMSATPVERPIASGATKPVSAGDPLTAVPGFEAPPFVLNGVVRGKGEPLAIINGRILKVGDGIEAATLAEIAQESARLRWPDRELIIRINR